MHARRIIVPLAALLMAGCAPLPPPAPAGPRSGAVSTVPVSRVARPEPPVLKRLNNGHYRVQRPWTVVLDGRAWHVPRGYSSNGITAPAGIKRSLGDGVGHPETWAAVFHDWLFTQPGISRSTADRLFHDLLLAYGVPPQKARLMHATVAGYSLSKKFH